MTTQDHLPIKDIKDDVAILKDGSYLVVLQTTAVNFDLLSENEQLAIIATFAALLNSLSFSIQLTIRSKRLDISSYLAHLLKAEEGQANPLMRQMINRYRSFVETIIRENEVLDKQFFIALSVSGLEVGLERDQEKRFQKAMTILMPRRDHIMRQISRIGLKVTQLSGEKLVQLFYDIYNEQPVVKPVETALPVQEQKQVGVAPQPAPIQPVATNFPNPNQPVTNGNSAVTAPVVPAAPVSNAFQATVPIPAASTSMQRGNSPYNPQSRTSYTSPFVVEELPDEYGTTQG